MDFAVDTESYENEVECANDWAEEHAWLLELVFRAFADSGRWPQIGALQRQLLRSGDKRELLDAVRQIPPSLGNVGYDDLGNGGVAHLSVRGLSYCDEASDLLSDLVRWINLAYRNYLADDEPQITRAQVAREVGREGQALDALSEVFLGENWIFNGGNGSAKGDWVRGLDDNVRHLNSVETISDYLEAQADVLYLRPYSGAAMVGRAGERLAAEPASSDPGAGASAREATLEWLDPAIGEVAQKLFDDAHYVEAVTQASLALAEHVRKVAGLGPDSTLDGEDLMGYAFGGANPRICIPAEDCETQHNLQVGTRLMAQGVMRGIRNPFAHRRVELSADEALEMLAAMSLVARRARLAKGATGKERSE